MLDGVGWCWMAKTASNLRPMGNSRRVGGTKRKGEGRRRTKIMMSNHGLEMS